MFRLLFTFIETSLFLFFPPHFNHPSHLVEPFKVHTVVTMKTSTIILTASQALLATASPLYENQERASSSSCPSVHVFGARETTASAGFGSSSTVVNLITAAYSGATSEAISYPACGGQSSCGSVSYADSANQGTSAVATAVNAYVEQCPDTDIVLVGYSQGGQIMDNALCGGGDTAEGITSTSVPLSTAAVAQIKAAIFMGDPRFVSGVSYDVGTCEAGGVSFQTLPPTPFSHPLSFFFKILLLLYVSTLLIPN